MKVLLINGSPNQFGATYRALSEMVKVFNDEGVETEIVHIGAKPISGCIACKGCYTLEGGCVIDEIVNEIAEKFKYSDGLVVASPVYYASANGTLISLLDRLFQSSRFESNIISLYTYNKYIIVNVYFGFFLFVI